MLVWTVTISPRVSGLGGMLYAMPIDIVMKLLYK